MRTVHDTIRSHRAPPEPRRFTAAMTGITIAALGVLVGALVVQPTRAESSSPAGDVAANGLQAMYVENWCESATGTTRHNEADKTLRDVWFYQHNASMAGYTNPTCPSPSPSGSPTPSPSPTGVCLDALRKVDRCGWPTAASTGPRAPVVLTNYTGPLPLVIPAGQTRSGLIVPGCVRLMAGASLVDSIVRPTASTLCGGYAAVDQEFSSIQRDVALRFVEVDLHLAGSNRMNIRAITGSGFELDHVHCWGGADCVHYGAYVSIHDSYLHTPPCLTVQSASVCNGYHIDALHSASSPVVGAVVEIVGNTIVAEENTATNYATSAWINGPDMNAYGGFPQSNVHGINNLFAGGGFTVYCEAHAEQASSVPMVEFVGNRVSDLYYPRGGYWGATTDCKNNVPTYSGNTYDRTGADL